MAFLIAISALLASLKPIVDRKTTIGGWVLAGLGVTAATITIVSVVIGWGLHRLEAKAAKHRQ